jgi:hypothetical protein
MNNLRFRLYDVTKHALGVYRKYVEQKLALRLEGDHVIFRGDLRHHKDTRTNFTISNTSGAMGSPKVPQMEFLDIALTENSRFFCSLLFTVPGAGTKFLITKFLTHKVPINKIPNHKIPK